jgi:hypothetical protein
MDGTIPTEYQECVALAQWLDRHEVIYTHVPLGGLRDAKTAAILKRIGTQAGVPDYLIFSRPTRTFVYRGIAIEVKRRLGACPSRQQLQWIDRLDGCGWLTIVAYGAGDAVNKLQTLGFGASV